MSTVTNGTYINNVFKDMPFAVEIRETAAEAGASVYFVGGCVRDALMGRPVHDVDIVPFGTDYEKFARALAKKARAFAVPFKDNVRLARGAEICDVSKPRGVDIETDRMKRDFTINNLAAALSGEITGSMEDIKNRVIRAVYPGVFDDDPLRVLRGFRFAACLGFSVEEGTFRLAAEKSPRLKNVASERITEELAKTFSGPYLEKALPLLKKSRALAAVFPEVELDFEALLRFEKKDFSLAAALLAGESALKRLSLSAKDAKTAEYMIKHFREAAAWGDLPLRDRRAALWKHYARAESLLAFTAAKLPEQKKALEELAALLPGINAAKAKNVSGELLKNMGFAPGPLFGRIIEDTAEKLALDELETAYIKKYIEKNYGGKK